jgi:hypothetical protein
MFPRGYTLTDRYLYKYILNKEQPKSIEKDQKQEKPHMENGLLRKLLYDLVKQSLG